MRFINLIRTNPFLRDLNFRISALSDVSYAPHRSIMRQLSYFPNAQIFDAGANIGQFGIDMRKSGFGGQIFSFEPVSDTFEELRKTIVSYQPWDAYKLGLGSSESTMDINISGNFGLSSSFLTMNGIHLQNFPKSKTLDKERITVSTIDKQIDLLGINSKHILLKMDVQGFEFEALKGAYKHLNLIPLCFLEVSLKPLYSGEASLLEILNLLATHGHEVVDVFRGIKSKNGELLQLDVLTKNINS